MPTSTPSERPRDVQAELLGLDEEDRTMRRAAFLAVLDGRSITLKALAQRGNRARARLEGLVARGLLTLGADGLVVGACGLSLVPVPDRPHRLTIGERTWWTWCAVDAVGIPAALGQDALAETACSWCGAAVRLVFRSGLVADASHPDARLWLAEHVKGRGLAQGTCGLMNLFCSPGHLTAWRAAHPDQPGKPVDLAEAANVGRSWWGPLLEDRAGDHTGCCP